MTQSSRFEFTDQGLKGLPIPPKPQQVDYHDTKVRGLGLRISYGGRRAFFCMYFNAAKKRQRLSLGEYGLLEHGRLSLAEARKAAAARLLEVAADHDPAAEARAVRQAPTMRELAVDFIETPVEAGIKTAGRQEAMLAKDVLPKFADTKARDFSRADVKAILKAIKARGSPIMANRVHEVLRTMLNHAIVEQETYGVVFNVATLMKKIRSPEHGRDRWLTKDELGAYWKALDDIPDAPATALRLCLLTGQRQQNILSMRVDQLALDDNLWIIPARETKTSRAYRVPLSKWAVQIIEERIAGGVGEQQEKVGALRNFNAYLARPLARAHAIHIKKHVVASMLQRSLQRTSEQLANRVSAIADKHGLGAHVTPSSRSRSDKPSTRSRCSSESWL